MQETDAQKIVAALQKRRVIATVARLAVYQFGVRIPLGDGREALWDVDGAAGLEAQIMANGMLVGFIPTIEKSENFTLDEQIEAIASAKYPS